MTARSTSIAAVSLPMLACHREAFEAYMADKASGEPGYVEHSRIGAKVEERPAEMTRLPAGSDAFLGNASEGIGRVISSIAWRPGDNVVVSANDYASELAGLVRLSVLEVEPRVVSCEGWLIGPQALLDACDNRTPCCISARSPR